MVKKSLLLAIFLFVVAGCQYFRSASDPLYNILEQGVKEFDAKGGKIFITNVQTKQIYRAYSVGECAFTPFNLHDEHNCIIKDIDINGQYITTYSCTLTKSSSSEVETVAYANIVRDNQKYTIWVVLNSPQPKKKTFGFKTAPWNAFPVLHRALSILIDY